MNPLQNKIGRLKEAIREIKEKKKITDECAVPIRIQLKKRIAFNYN